MLTLLLLAVVIAVAVAGAEFVRSTCRRQLLDPVVAPYGTESAD